MCRVVHVDNSLTNEIECVAWNGAECQQMWKSVCAIWNEEKKSFVSVHSHSQTHAILLCYTQSHTWIENTITFIAIFFIRAKRIQQLGGRGTMLRHFFFVVHLFVFVKYLCDVVRMKNDSTYVIWWTAKRTNDCLRNDHVTNIVCKNINIVRYTHFFSNVFYIQILQAHFPADFFF